MADASEAVARWKSFDAVPEVAADGGPEQPLYHLQLLALQALYDAELCRGRLDPSAGAAWLAAADACHEGLLAWDERIRAGGRREGRCPIGSTETPAAPLRRAHELAVDCMQRRCWQR